MREWPWPFEFTYGDSRLKVDRLFSLFYCPDAERLWGYYERWNTNEKQAKKISSSHSGQKAGPQVDQRNSAVEWWADQACVQRTCHQAKEGVLIDSKKSELRAQSLRWHHASLTRGMAGISETGYRRKWRCLYHGDLSVPNGTGYLLRQVGSRHNSWIWG